MGRKVGLWLSIVGALSGACGPNRGAQEPKGRLPPEHIQEVVRSNFYLFRECYQAGLARNPDLKGRVSARFVIAADGTVSNVADGGSDMPDREVAECILKAYYKLRFVPPSGNGIVTVVYPIRLAPGGKGEP